MRRPDLDPILVVLGGLPATGKSTVAQEVAGRTGAFWLRIDTIEQSVVGFEAEGVDRLAVRHAVHWGLGYDVAHALATDLLSQGIHVFAECVNPLKVTRDAWCDVAEAAHAELVEVELICSDQVEHEHRARTRTVDVPGLVLPTWQDIVERDYEPWDRDHLVLDTAGRSPEETVEELSLALGVG